MTKFNFDPFPLLSTDRLTLRQLGIKDQNEYFLLKSDDRMFKFLDYPPKTLEESIKKVHQLNEDIRHNKSITWAITEKNHDCLVGTICYWNLSEDRQKAEIGYELLPYYQGKGYLSEAIKEVITYGFNNMKLSYIEALTNLNHIKSRNLLERSNFVLENENDEMAVYFLRNI
jgi:[ribosomal protein S5]-alanine N-acetyltransferase